MRRGVPVKTTMMRILLLAAAMVLALSLCVAAHAEEPAAAEAWLLYFASNHVENSADFPWWPQHQRIDQSADETGVEYTNAIVTGPGYYTTSLKFNWQKAEGAIQFNLIIKDAEKLFPGYYCEIVDIRVNGESIEVGENLYGTYHDDTDSGMVSIYNTYWDTKWEPNATGPSGHRAWDNAEQAHWLIINPDDIVAGDTIEVDFFFAEEAGVKPDGAPALRVLDEGPAVHGKMVTLAGLSDIQLNAWMNFADGDWWPNNSSPDNQNGFTMKNAVVTGEGSYTVGVNMDKGWNGGVGAVGLSNTYIVIENGETELPGSYVQITDIRVDGESVAFNNNLTVPWTWDNGNALFSQDHTTVPLYVSWMNDTDHNTWNRREWGENATCAVLDPSLINDAGSVEVDFIVTSEAGAEPEIPVYEYDYQWYPNNTMGVAGYSLRDLGITGKWYNAVPVNLTVDGIYKIPLVASNMYVIGNAIVTVEGDNVTVTYETRLASPGNLTISSECVKWFSSIDEITAEFCENPQSDIAFGDAVSKSAIGDIGYLFICNGVTYCQPITDNGVYLPQYIHNYATWQAYRAELDAMVEAVTAPAAE